jgi:O-antigen ligase
VTTRTQSSPGSADRGGAVAAIVFVLVFAYFWVSLNPFADLSSPDAALPWGGNSNVVNQIVVVAMAGVLFAAIRRHASRHLLLQPHVLLFVILVWFSAVSLFAADPATALRRITFTVLVCFSGNALLLLPRSEESFAKLLGVSLLAALVLAYFGVVAVPARAIHQATDAVEGVLAGDWRGQFGHKNAAAAAMVIVIFCGFYVTRTWSRWLGIVIVAAATVFLVKTGGKTAMGMLPLILILAGLFERYDWLRLPIALGGPLALNIIAIGASVSEPIKGFLLGLGIDPTFTDRAGVWRLAMAAIADRPWTGYGFQSFWQTDSLVYGGDSVETWAVTAAHSHNAYLEAMINAGVPGLCLVVVWLIILPIADASRASRSGNDPTLSRLFVRIWLFSIFAACLESNFFTNGGPLWFSMLLAVAGLRLQARASLVHSPISVSVPAFAHA